MFHDMYVTAKRARTQRAIFCGWWRNELYSADPNSAVYKTYWDGKVTPEEKEWTKDIRKLYNFEITTRQLAWWRWKLNEGIKDDALMYQEFPPTEDYAFVMTGSSFFSNSKCTDAVKGARMSDPDCYRYTFGINFHDTEIIKSNPKIATLKVWEEPVDTAYYVIGADPAYGSSDWADRFCIQVYRCYADGMDQVAEFATSELNTYQFAWVIAHLAGAYKNSTLNLELNGPGQPVVQELRNLKRQANVIASIPETKKQGEALVRVLSSMQNYIWRKNDTLGGLSNSIGVITTQATKERMMTYFKDYFERDMLTVKSEELIEEMKTIRREGSSIMAPGRSKDDRVMATAMATMAWAEQVQPQLILRRITRDNSRDPDPNGNGPAGQAVGRNVKDYLARIGFGPD